MTGTDLLARLRAADQGYDSELRKNAFGLHALAHVGGHQGVSAFLADEEKRKKKADMVKLAPPKGAPRMPPPPRIKLAVIPEAQLLLRRLAMLQKQREDVLRESTGMGKMAKKDRKWSYRHTLAASAPIFAAKALMGDLPRKTVEDIVERGLETKLLKAPKIPTRDLVGKAFKGKAMWTAGLGGGAGILTAPIFLRGIQLASSKKKSDRRKGMGLIAGSGLAYSGIKGLGEGVGMARGRGIKGTGALASGVARSVARGAWKLPGAVLLGGAIAAGRSKKKGSKSDKYLKPALIGAGVGAGIGGTGSLLSHVGEAPKGTKARSLFRTLGTGAGLKRLVPGLVAGGVGGLAGTAITALVVDKALKRMKRMKGRKG